ncbi:MAG TPA: LysR family transcriptional regulator [Candidatus Aquilonibacter sp.]|nr:LysR family transcriptional regulator [Candidatus Aquilonibacter sp.]
MDIRQLESFLSVIDSPTMSRAAETLHLSTGAVSLQVRALSSELKSQLFVRSGRKLAPTPAGRRLAEHARTILLGMKQIREEFGDDPETDTRPFHLATGATTLIYRLRRPLKLVRKRYPKIDIHVTVLATEEIIAGLKEQQFDLGLISLPVADKSLGIVPLYNEELLVVRPSASVVRGHHVGVISASELQGAPLLLYPKHSNMRRLIDRFLDELGVHGRVIMEASDTEAIKGLVEAGFGYSILPEYALKQSSKFFHTARIRGRRLIRRQALAMPLSAQARSLTQNVALFLKNSFNEA